MRINIFSKFRTLFLRLWDVSLFLSREGSWKLYPHERQMISVAASYFGEKVSEAVSNQLEQPFFVERTNPRISVLRFYQKSDDQGIQEEKFLDQLTKLHLEVGGVRQIANVTFYERYIFSVETKNASKSYVRSPIKIVKVEDGTVSDSFTAAINQYEHKEEV